jgi:hypothetical protein
LGNINFYEMKTYTLISYYLLNLLMNTECTRWRNLRTTINQVVGRRGSFYSDLQLRGRTVFTVWFHFRLERQVLINVSLVIDVIMGRKTLKKEHGIYDSNPFKVGKDYFLTLIKFYMRFRCRIKDIKWSQHPKQQIHYH